MFTKRTPPPPERARRPLPPTQRTTQVFSYHANRDPRNTGVQRDVQGAVKAPKRDGPRFAWLQRAPQIVVVGVVVVLGLLSLRLGSDVRIEVVGSAEGKIFLRSTEVYAQAAQKAFAAPMNGNKVSVDTAKISKDLLRQFPELEAASISLPFIGSQPVVYVQPADPKLILASQSGLYVLDDNGRALLTGNQVAELEKLNIPVVNDQSGLPIAAGKIALPRATVAFIDAVSFQLKAKNLKITSYTLPVGTYELHVKPEGVGYFVKFNVYGNAREETGAFLALKDSLDKQRKQPKEYMDVRVEGRAYYK